MRLVGYRFSFLFFPFFCVDNQDLSPRYCSLFPKKAVGILPVTGTLVKEGVPYPHLWDSPVTPERSEREWASGFLSTF